MANIVEAIIERAASNPLIFEWVRRVLEGDFVAEKLVIRGELLSSPTPRHGPQRVLDLGCGTGYFSPLFDPAGYVGVDLSQRFVAHARRAHPEHAFCFGDACRLGFADGSFDDVLVLGILHHLNDDRASEVLVEARRVLRPGGRMLVIEDARHDPDTLHHDHSFGPLAHLGLHIFQWADVGDFIRPGQDYAPLFGKGLRVDKTFTLHSGVCYYQVFVATREA